MAIPFPFPVPGFPSSERSDFSVAQVEFLNQPADLPTQTRWVAGLPK
jgi:hypothetical protein